MGTSCTVLTLELFNIFYHHINVGMHYNVEQLLLIMFDIIVLNFVADTGGTIVLVGQDGVQQPPIHFPKGGHLLAFLSCLENGLLPHGQMDPPLWSQRGRGNARFKLYSSFQKMCGTLYSFNTLLMYLKSSICVLLVYLILK